MERASDREGERRSMSEKDISHNLVIYDIFCLSFKAEKRIEINNNDEP